MSVVPSTKPKTTATTTGNAAQPIFRTPRKTKPPSSNANGIVTITTTSLLFEELPRVLTETVLTHSVFGQPGTVVGRQVVRPHQRDCRPDRLASSAQMGAHLCTATGIRAPQGGGVVGVQEAN